MSHKTLRVRGTDLSCLVDECAVWFLAKRRSGKSTNMIATCMERDSDHNVVFSDQDKVRREWAEVVPPLFVHKANVRKLTELIAFYKMRVGMAMDEYRAEFGTLEGFVIPLECKVDIWLDDCGSNKVFMSSPAVRSLLIEGRQFGASVFIASQEYTQVVAGARKQFDYVCIMNCVNRSETKMLYDQYATGINLTFEDFTNLIIETTCGEDKRGNMIVIDNSLPSIRPENKLLYYMSKYPYEKRQVSEKQWEYHRQHYLSRKRQEELESVETLTECDDVEEHYEADTLDEYPDHALKRVVGGMSTLQGRHGTVDVQFLPVKSKWQ